MKTVRRTLLEGVALVLIGGLVGLVANSVRARGLDLTRDYFEKPPPDLPHTKQEALDSGGRQKTPTSSPSPGIGVVTLKEIAPWIQDNTGRYLFVDARDDLNYQSGHIPGAVQVDHYFKDEYLPQVLPQVEDAEKVVVYCNGGSCEDSKFVCGDLLNEGIPADKLFLFTGGWEAWVEAQLPIETAEEHPE